MNKKTVGALVQRAYEMRRSELGSAKWKAHQEIAARADVVAIDREIEKLKDRRKKLVDAFVDPRVKAADKDLDALKKQYSKIEAKLGFAITPDERADATRLAKRFLETLPNCVEAKLIQ